MPSQDEVEELKAKKLCYRCVGEDYLSAEIRRDGKRRRCSYCDRTAKSYLIGEMAERIEIAFDQHYARTSDQPTSWQLTMLSDRESNYEWDRDGEQTVYAIMNSADMPEAAAEDIQQILEDKFDDFDSAAMGEETEFSSDAYYEQKGTSDQVWQEEWRSFEKSLKTEARFFSRAAASHLAAIFNGIDALRSHDGHPLVVDAGPSTTFTSVYRARVFQSADKLEAALCQPDQQLGSPPTFLATAGRMNARGISVFYGADDPTAAIAEVRPPVGSQVAVARFEIIRPLRLLDLTALSAVSDGGSVFDYELAGRLERAMFLRSLSQRITRPVMPDDEAFEYLTTQAVADYLATEGAVPLDGILFPSVQAAGAVLNVVLFHKAARVEKIDVPVGTEISARSGHMEDEDWEIEYEVIERVPPTVAVEPTERQHTSRWPDFASLAMTPWEPADPDWREPALRIISDSICVHIIRRVQFETDEHHVTRHRWVKRDANF
ncbi:RES family NAD+ phosphorylase [Rhizobium leguminosarum]|uniref:RES family NAD+ phosphorylase n=1 Tax=Rhizobium leguminosarum TaxID=384 RepID=UPI0013B00D8E|nr:RES family NAD+ phosphorylase [Rhizobium leguminosarum]MBY5421053.1 RES family NAD+ phosphorylase [Rhizobium leguminosarum]MBY5791461.1 RES family NAD+ phosphorylase [Rhizobium leguminosarum]NKL87563.1 RES domain-containing protein [Rhizobium leguminosarum bv. viciae]